MNNSFDEKTYALFSHPTNKKIISELEKKGAKVFQFPPLSTEKLALNEKSVSEIKNLNNFDWIIFPDVLTVDYFLEVLTENEIDLFEMDLLQVCAFGEAVADCLRFAQLHADIVSTSAETTKIFAALTDYIGKTEIESKRFLIVREISFDYQIEKVLIENGAKVLSLPIYQTKISEEITKLKVLLKGGAIDEFIFSTPSDLIALKIYFKDEFISKILSEIRISAVDKSVFQTLREHDFKTNYFRLK